MDCQRIELLKLVGDYSMPNVPDKIDRMIHSYTDYVNKIIWKKTNRDYIAGNISFTTI